MNKLPFTLLLLGFSISQGLFINQKTEISRTLTKSASLPNALSIFVSELTESLRGLHHIYGRGELDYLYKKTSIIKPSFPLTNENYDVFHMKARHLLKNFHNLRTNIISRCYGLKHLKTLNNLFSVTPIPAPNIPSLCDNTFLPLNELFSISALHTSLEQGVKSALSRFHMLLWYTLKAAVKELIQEAAFLAAHSLPHKKIIAGPHLHVVQDSRFAYTALMRRVCLFMDVQIPRIDDLSFLHLDNVFGELHTGMEEVKDTICEKIKPLFFELEKQNVELLGELWEEHQPSIAMTYSFISRDLHRYINILNSKYIPSKEIASALNSLSTLREVYPQAPLRKEGDAMEVENKGNSVNGSNLETKLCSFYRVVEAWRVKSLYDGFEMEAPAFIDTSFGCVYKRERLLSIEMGKLLFTHVNLAQRHGDVIHSIYSPATRHASTLEEIFREEEDKRAVAHLPRDPEIDKQTAEKKKAEEKETIEALKDTKKYYEDVIMIAHGLAEKERSVGAVTFECAEEEKPHTCTLYVAENHVIRAESVLHLAPKGHFARQRATFLSKSALIFHTDVLPLQQNYASVTAKAKKTPKKNNSAPESMTNQPEDEMSEEEEKETSPFHNKPFYRSMSLGDDIFAFSKVPGLTIQNEGSSIHLTDDEETFTQFLETIESGDMDLLMSILPKPAEKKKVTDALHEEEFQKLFYNQNAFKIHSESYYNTIKPLEEALMSYNKAKERFAAINPGAELMEGKEGQEFVLARKEYDTSARDLMEIMESVSRARRMVVWNTNKVKKDPKASKKKEENTEKKVWSLKKDTYLLQNPISQHFIASQQYTIEYDPIIELFIVFNINSNAYSPLTFLSTQMISLFMIMDRALSILEALHIYMLSLLPFAPSISSTLFQSDEATFSSMDNFIESITKEVQGLKDGFSLSLHSLDTIETVHLVSVANTQFNSVRRFSNYVQVLHDYISQYAPPIVSNEVILPSLIPAVSLVLKTISLTHSFTLIDIAVQAFINHSTNYARNNFNKSFDDPVEVGKALDVMKLFSSMAKSVPNQKLKMSSLGASLVSRHRQLISIPSSKSLYEYRSALLGITSKNRVISSQDRAIIETKNSFSWIENPIIVAPIKPTPTKYTEKKNAFLTKIVTSNTLLIEDESEMRKDMKLVVSYLRASPLMLCDKRLHLPYLKTKYGGCHENYKAMWKTVLSSSNWNGDETFAPNLTEEYVLQSFGQWLQTNPDLDTSSMESFKRFFVLDHEQNEKVVNSNNFYSWKMLRPATASALYIPFFGISSRKKLDNGSVVMPTSYISPYEQLLIDSRFGIRSSYERNTRNFTPLPLVSCSVLCKPNDKNSPPGPIVNMGAPGVPRTVEQRQQEIQEWLNLKKLTKFYSQSRRYSVRELRGEEKLNLTSKIYYTEFWSIREAPTSVPPPIEKRKSKPVEEQKLYDRKNWREDIRIAIQEKATHALGKASPNDKVDIEKWRQESVFATFIPILPKPSLDDSSPEIVKSYWTDKLKRGHSCEDENNTAQQVDESLSRDIVKVNMDYFTTNLPFNRPLFNEDERLVKAAEVNTNEEESILPNPPSDTIQHPSEYQVMEEKGITEKNELLLTNPEEPLTIANVKTETVKKEEETGQMNIETNEERQVKEEPVNVSGAIEEETVLKEEVKVEHDRKSPSSPSHINSTALSLKASKSNSGSQLDILSSRDSQGELTETQEQYPPPLPHDNNFYGAYPQWGGPTLSNLPFYPLPLNMNLLPYPYEQDPQFNPAAFLAQIYGPNHGGLLLNEIATEGVRLDSNSINNHHSEIGKIQIHKDDNKNIGFIRYQQKEGDLLSKRSMVSEKQPDPLKKAKRNNSQSFPSFNT